VTEHHLSERHACALVGLSLDSYRHTSAPSALNVHRIHTAQATGLWFEEQTMDTLIAAVNRFETLPVPISPLVCRPNAEKFSNKRFRQEFDGFVQLRWAEFQASLGARA